jgi:hypothetical protein
MKKIVLFVGLSTLVFSAKAQQPTPSTTAEKEFAVSVEKAYSVKITKAVRDLTPDVEELTDGKIYIVNNKLRRYRHDNPDALPKGDDPVWQRQRESHYNRAPLQNWEGLNSSSMPFDPSGAAGPNHYVQMINTQFAVYNKSGTLLHGPFNLGTLLGGGNDGDPIVMYDAAADRWFLSQFRSSNNSLQIAVSTTADPTGTYYNYSFPLNNFPDYPKYAIWGNAYFISANKGAPQFYALERDKMLAGDVSASIISFNVPQLSTNGFFSILPAHATGSLPNPSTPGYIFYFQDDGWAGVSADGLKIWEVNVNWASPGSSSISAPQVLPVSPFDSQFNASWNDIQQPGVSQKLDGVPTAMMYMAQYREFPGYASVVLNHTVDVNGSDQGGIRWYELRKAGANPWTLHQEGTFSPDNQSRWMGSICMDYQGNIGLAYNVSGSTVFPSIRYTGRYASDPLGQMTFAEETIIDGTGTQSGGNRWGDYAHMMIDPTDDATFWYTGMYVASGGARKTRIASFKIASDEPDDLGIVAITSPSNGVLSASEQITVTIYNFGTDDQANFPVAYEVNGNTPVVETYVGTLAAGTSDSYTFAAPVNMSTPGYYQLKAYTGLLADAFNPNDTTFKTVQHLFGNDVGVSTITAPASGTGLGGAAAVTVTLQNYGANAQTSIPVNYSINGGPVVTENFTGTLTSGANTSFTFTTTADLSNLGNYNFVAYTTLPGDAELVNDTAVKLVEHTLCQPTADCSLGDGFREFKIGTINNTSNCSPSGYGDFTNLNANLEQGGNYPLTIRSGYTNQVATVWIDFNDNFVFETNERVLTNVPFGTTAVTVNLPIDAAATMGQHLMRARTNWAQFGTPSITDPCVDVNYGETEDYKVTIMPYTGISELYAGVELSVIDMGAGLFTIKVTGLNEEASIDVHNTIGQKVYQSGTVSMVGTYEHQLNLANHATGHYLVKIGNGNFSKVQKITLR